MSDDYVAQIAELVERASNFSSRDTAQIIGEFLGTLISEVGRLRTEVNELKIKHQFMLGAIDGLLKILEQEGVESDG